VRRLLAAAAIASSLGLGATAFAAWPEPAHGAGAVRTVHLTIHFSRFEPGAVPAAPGETIRFVIENTDPIDHEFILGDGRIHRIHEKGTEASHAPRPGEVSVPAHATAETTYTFPSASGGLLFACHLPGHLAYGMSGVVTMVG
jgi:uncharacterized cupredoxin-like copper-binding protein